MRERTKSDELAFRVNNSHNLECHMVTLVLGVKTETRQIEGQSVMYVFYQTKEEKTSSAFSLHSAL